jgi:hypothetical protein
VIHCVCRYVSHPLSLCTRRLPFGQVYPLDVGHPSISLVAVEIRIGMLPKRVAGMWMRRIP